MSAADSSGRASHAPGWVGIVAVAIALALGGGLVAWYAAAGGTDYKPLAVRDPCQPRDWRSPQGLDAITQQIALSALDGAACELRVTREALALALTSDSSRKRFAREHGLTEAGVENAIRAGLRRSVADAKRAGKLGDVPAFLIDQAIDNLPITKIIEALQKRSLDPLLE